MIKKFSPGKEKEISLMIQTVFDEFVGHEYSDKGNTVFKDFIKPGNILKRYNKGNIIMIYEKNNKIIGMMEIRDYYHICLFFVDKNYHNKGIGKQLFNSILNQIKGKTDFIEVNASPFSVEIYSKLGFNKADEIQEKNGIKFIPMKMNL